MVCSNHLQSRAEAKIFVKTEVERHCTNVMICCYGSLYLFLKKQYLPFQFHLSDEDQHRHKKIFGSKIKYLFFSLSCHLCICVRTYIYSKKFIVLDINCLKILQKKKYCMKWGCRNAIWCTQKYSKNQGKIK